MEFCHKVGIRYTEFLMWPEQDQEAEISYMLYEREKCHSCGTNPDEWLDEEGKHLEPQPYEVKSVACLGCEALDEARKSVPEERRGSVHLYLAPVAKGKKIRGPQPSSEGRGSGSIRR